MLKLSPAVVSMNKTFPSMNTQSKSTASNATNDVHSTSKQQQQQRQPVRRSQPRAALFPTTATELVPSSVAPRGRSPSGVKRGPTRKFEPAKIIYRSGDFAWQDYSSSSAAAQPPPAPLTQPAERVPSAMKSKLTSPLRQLSNRPARPSSTSASPAGHRSHAARNDLTNIDLLQSSTSISRSTGNMRTVNNRADRSPADAGHTLPLLHDKHRSSRPRLAPSKQLTSKMSFHDMTSGEFYFSGTKNEQSQPQISVTNRPAHLNRPHIHRSNNRKVFSSNKSNEIPHPAPGTSIQASQSSLQEAHRTEPTADTQSHTQSDAHGPSSKENMASTGKYRSTSDAFAAKHHLPMDRHRSSQSRDANISYAYTDVRKYIADNELMSPEREQMIRAWVADVEQYRHELQMID